MAYNLKEIAKKPERLTGGHRMCAGCGAPVVVRQILRALKTEDHAVIGCATGCLEVCTFIYPYTAWKDSFIHNAFENSAASISGAEAAYVALKERVKSTMKRSLSPSAETAELMISDYRHYRALWKEDMIWFMSATTTVPI